MGRLTAAILAIMAFSPVYGQYYTVKIKTVVDKTQMPEAVFRMEEGSSQMKGFEAKIEANGFGVEGHKPWDVAEKEIREEYAELLEEELSRKPEEKVQQVLMRLESEAKRLEVFGEPLPADKNASRKPSSSRGGSNEAYKLKLQADKARAEYLEYKEKAERAQRNTAIMKELVEKIDERSKKRLEDQMLKDLRRDGFYFYGTYSNVDLVKVKEGSAAIELEYALSHILGWVEGDGNNNNNSINNGLDIEYVELPKSKAIVKLGKPYCFQIARPVKQGGTLKDAQNSTSIFANMPSGSEQIAPIGQPGQQANQDGTLNAQGEYSDIIKQFRGKEKQVVRVVVTVTKS